MQKVFVTASTGNIGSQIVKNISTQNIPFSAGVNSTAGLEKNQIQMDFDDKGSLQKAFAGHDTVFLLFPMHEKMVQWSKNAVTAAKATGVKHIIRSSGAGADVSSSFFMPKIQGTIDTIIRNSGIDYTITKPASFMQNFVNFFSYDIKKGSVYQPAGDGQIAWVDVRDIAAVNTKVMLSPEHYTNKELTITGGENLSYSEALDVISKIIDKPITFVDIDAEKSIDAMKGYGMSQFSIDMMSSLNEIIKAGYASGTTETVQELTGKEPIKFKQFAMDFQANWQ